MIVVQDDPDQSTLFLPGGVRCGLPIGEDGAEVRLPDRPWRLEVRARGPQPALSFAWPDTPYAVLLWVGEDERLVWYVNLEEPIARTSIGFDTVDHALDVLIELDGSSWRWKDEEELAHAVRAGLFSEAEAADFFLWASEWSNGCSRASPRSTGTGGSGSPTPAGPFPNCSKGGERRSRLRGCRDRFPAGACHRARRRSHPRQVPRARSNGRRRPALRVGRRAGWLTGPRERDRGGRGSVPPRPGATPTARSPAARKRTA